MDPRRAPSPSPAAVLPTTALLLAIVLAAPGPARAQDAAQETGPATSDPVADLVAEPAAASPVGDDEVERLWRGGERRQALERMVARLEATPDDDALRARLAERLLSVHMFEAALEFAAPLGDEGHDIAGRALYFLGRYEEAEPRLRPLAARGGVHEALMLADALEALGRVDEADAVAAEALTRHGGDHAPLLSFLGRRAAARGEHAAALERFEAALALDPLLPEALYGRGQALVRSGRRDEGLAELQRHRELVPLMDAREHALRAVDLEPSHASNHALLADAERALGRTPLALDHYARAQALATPTELVPISLRHARALFEDVGRLDDAVALLDAAAERLPDARLPVRAGDMLAAAGRHTEARERYELALTWRPGEPAILQRLEAAREAVSGAARTGPPR